MRQAGPGDILSIIVYDHPELTTSRANNEARQRAVTSLIRTVQYFTPHRKTKVDGRRSMRYGKYYEPPCEFVLYPQIEVRVAQFNSKFVFVTGAVNSPVA